MAKLAKYLRPYASAVVLSVVLLIAQAACDLSLPNYMSDIVNVGIQQGGVADAFPEAVSADGLSFLEVFMTAEERKTVEESYTLLSSGGVKSVDDRYAERYPLLKTRDIYILSETGRPARDKLGRIFGETAWTFINAMKVLAAQGGNGMRSVPPGSADIAGADLSKLYPYRSLFEKLPAGQMEQARAAARKNPDSMLLQSGAALTRNFYRELGMDLGKLRNGYLVRTGALMLLLTLAGGAATVLVGLLSSRLSAGVARDLRKDVFAKVESFSGHEFDRFSTASLITRTTNDVTQLQMLLMTGLRVICYAPIIGAGGVVLALKKSASMSWIIALVCVILTGVILVVYRIAVPRFRLIQKLVDRVNLVARESLNGLMVIRAFGRREFEEERFDRANSELTGNLLFVNRVMVFMMPVMTLIFNGASLLIVWVGSHEIAQSAMQVGDMMAFMQYSMQIIMSFLMISMMFILVPRAAVSASRISEVLAVRPAVRDPEHAERFRPDRKGYVEFRGVSFRYEGAEEDALSGVTFTAEPGRTTAIIGPTGSGKTTLVSLVPRFYDATAGEILVNGADVRKVGQRELRAQIGFVPQKGILLSGTVGSNLRYAKKDATAEELRSAAETAQAMEFIGESPEGFERTVAQGGGNVSGGQKQRLSIARALVKNPSVYIFDDSFSALDFKTDAALRKALKEKTRGSTVLIVSQRVGTILDADQILVLDEGRIVGRGTHRELLKTCPVYYEIASSQLTREELA